MVGLLILSFFFFLLVVDGVLEFGVQMVVFVWLLWGCLGDDDGWYDGRLSTLAMVLLRSRDEMCKY